MNNKPLFELYADATLDAVRGTYAQRGTEYADTWAVLNPLAVKAVMAKFGIPEPPIGQLKAIIAAALVDVKYQRIGGGYKEDSLIDGIAYSALLVGMMGELSRKPAAKPQSTADIFDDHNDNAKVPCHCEVCEPYRQALAAGTADKAVATPKQDANRGEPASDPGLPYFKHNAGNAVCDCDICGVYRVNNP